jgi:hypothetical protein
VNAVTELCGARPRPEKDCVLPRIHVTVLSTTDRETSAALAAAGTLARDLDADIRLVAFIIVPFPLELTQPPIPASFTINRSTTLARNLNIEMQLQICYCREVAGALGVCLGVKSLVIMGRQRRWWSWWETRLTRLVRSQGHQIVVVDVD